MNDKWMDDLKNQLGDYRKDAPEGLLDDIKQEMCRRGVMPNQKVPVKKPVIGYKRQIWWKVAVAALLAIAGIGIVEWNNNRSVSSNSIVHTARVNSTNSSKHGITEVDSKEQENSHVLASLYPMSNHRYLVSDRDQEYSLQGCLKEDIQEDYHNSTSEHAQVTPFSEDESHESTSASIIIRKPSTSLYAQNTSKASVKRQQADETLSLGAWYGSSMTGNSSAQQMAMVYASTSICSFDAMDTHEYIDEALTQIYNKEFIQAAMPTVKAKHHQPVKVGVSVRYQLNPKWSLLAGLTYSYLHSEFTEDVRFYQSVTDQKLHYVGIPLSVSYSFWRNPHFNIYVTGGVEAEKLVSGKAEHRMEGYLMQKDQKLSETKSSEAENVSERRPVFSTNVAVGAEYHISDNLSLYVEPGANYYFKNGSGVLSSYTENPFIFNLHLGMRWHVNR